MAFSTEKPDLSTQSSCIAMDGVDYALVRNAGSLWRVGSLNPAWPEMLAAFGATPDDGALKKLSAASIWPGTGRPHGGLAVMCCGLGSVWPGMGRELYDNFPVAREAMDRIAAMAHWDVLGLMDEPDIEKINAIRWQIPYLFLLEYAQWSQLVSLGLKPDILCGHSLGELVALCFAGVYSPRAAWHLLETRAEHMASLEKKARSQNSMLAVSADLDTITAILSKSSQIKISNANTPRQFILGGPRDELTAIRKELRAKRIPAFLLNMNLAFHNPAMSILRDLSFKRLSGLEMRPPQISMFSCVTTGEYPQTQPEICKYITGLDENTVNWTGLVSALAPRVGCFVEIGPQETLCGLVTENSPGSLCMPSGSRGAELLAMRRLCARLFSLGYLPYGDIVAQKKTNRQPLPAPANRQEKQESTPSPLPPAGELEIIMRLLGEVCGRPWQELRPELDLRYDLALRSSNFPFIVQEAEHRLGRTIELENLFQITTIGDLAVFLTGGTRPVPASSRKPEARQSVWQAKRAPLLRFSVEPAAENLSCQPIGINPCSQGLATRHDGMIIVCSALPINLFWSAIPPLCSLAAIPSELAQQCGLLRKAGCQIVFFDYKDRFLSETLAAILMEHGPCQGIIIADSETDGMPEAFAQIRSFRDALSPEAWTCHLRRFQSARLSRNILTGIPTGFFPTSPVNKSLSIAWLDPDNNFSGKPDECGDMLAAELLHGCAPNVLWAQWSDAAPAPQPYCLSAPCFLDIRPATDNRQMAESGVFRGNCQFSLFSSPRLAAHGCAAEPVAEKPAWLSPGTILAPMLKTTGTLLGWLEIHGFSDFRLFNFPAVPQGITRECELIAHEMPWIMDDGCLTRMCRTSLSVDKLAANGRHTGIMEPVADAVWFLSGKKPDLAALWPVEDVGAGGCTLDNTQIFYDTLAFGSVWRFLQTADLHKDDSNAGPDGPNLRLTARLTNISSPNEALFNFTDAFFQAAMLAIVFNENGLKGLTDSAGIASTLANWKFGGIGFLRYSLERIKNFFGNDLCLQLRLSWFKNHLARFDGQLVSDGAVLLAMHHMEFDRTA